MSTQSLQYIASSSAIVATQEAELAAPNDSWLRGLLRYLDLHAYGSVTARDLWNAIGAETGEDIVQLMYAWTYRPGFPVVNVTLGGPGGDSVLLSQVVTPTVSLPTILQGCAEILYSLFGASAYTCRESILAVSGASAAAGPSCTHVFWMPLVPKTREPKRHSPHQA